MEQSHKEKEKIREAALGLLDYQDRTRQELCRKLEKKGFSSALVQQVAGELVQSGLIDDARYAGLYAQSKLSCGKGSRWVLQKLKEKGVDARTAEAAVRALREEEMVEDESILCLKKALSLCGLQGQFQVTDEGALEPAEGTAPAGPVDYFGRKVDLQETDRMKIRREREKAKASLTRRLLGAGYPSGAVFDAVRKIGEL